MNFHLAYIRTYRAIKPRPVGSSHMLTVDEINRRAYSEIAPTVFPERMRTQREAAPWVPYVVKKPEKYTWISAPLSGVRIKIWGKDD